LFAACTAATPTSVVCDRGATATDHQDGDLTARVTACGGRWVSRGVGACLVNTSLPGRYNVTYAVADSGGLQVRFCRYRFCATGDLKYRGARRVRVQVHGNKRPLLLILRFDC
jgi:hypothetical protein